MLFPTFNITMHFNMKVKIFFYEFVINSKVHYKDDVLPWCSFSLIRCVWVNRWQHTDNKHGIKLISLETKCVMIIMESYVRVAMNERGFEISKVLFLFHWWLCTHKIGISYVRYIVGKSLTYAKDKNEWMRCTQHAMIGREKWSQMKSYYVHMITQNHLVDRFYIFIQFCYELHIKFLTILTRIWHRVPETWAFTEQRNRHRHAIPLRRKTQCLKWKRFKR